VYKDNTLYLEGAGINDPVFYSFTDDGTYKVEVTILDNSGYNTIVSPVYTIDKEKPIITVSKENIVIEKGNDISNLLKVKVTDNQDTNVAGHVKSNYSTVNLNTLGKKQISYTVSDAAGNVATKTVYIEVVKHPVNYLMYTEFSILLCLLVAVAIMFKYIRFIKIQKRFERFSVSSVKENELSILDSLSLKVNKYIKIMSKVFNKSDILRKYARRHDKYTMIYDEELSSMDLISMKVIFSLLFVVICTILLALKFKIFYLYELIIPFFVGIILVDIYYFIKYKIYRNKIENDLLQAVIIMNNGFKSGNSISQAINLVATQLNGPISREFKKIYIELSYGLDLNTVFKRFADRVDLEEASYLTTSLTILNKTGGNIIKIFSAIEKSLFNKKKLRQE
jgi:Flp pilus assembly protein TadB